MASTLTHTIVAHTSITRLPSRTMSAAIRATATTMMATGAAAPAPAAVASRKSPSPPPPHHHHHPHSVAKSSSTSATAVHRRRLGERRRGRGVGCAAAIEASSATAATQADFDALWEWLGSNGVDVSGVIPRLMDDSPGGRGWGLVAAKDLGANETAISVPKSLWMTRETAMASPVGPFCQGQLPWVAVALQLLHEKAIGEERERERGEGRGGSGGGEQTKAYNMRPYSYHPIHTPGPIIHLVRFNFSVKAPSKVQITVLVLVIATRRY